MRATDITDVYPTRIAPPGAAVFTNDPYHLIGAFPLTHQFEFDLCNHLLAQLKREVLFLGVERLQHARHIHDGQVAGTTTVIGIAQDMDDIRHTVTMDISSSSLTMSVRTMIN